MMDNSNSASRSLAPVAAAARARLVQIGGSHACAKSSISRRRLNPNEQAIRTGLLYTNFTNLHEGGQRPQSKTWSQKDEGGEFHTNCTNWHELESPSSS